MGRVNTGTTRLLIIAALVVAGIAVLLNGFSGDENVALPGGDGTTTSETPSPPESSSPTPDGGTTPATPREPGEVQILVFNGTNVAHLAGDVYENLVTQIGYVPVANAADSPVKPFEKTIVYFRGGAHAAQNEADARHIADTYLDGAKVSELDEGFATQAEVPRSADVVIVLGNDYAKANG